MFRATKFFIVTIILLQFGCIFPSSGYKTEVKTVGTVKYLDEILYEIRTSIMDEDFKYTQSSGELRVCDNFSKIDHSINDYISITLCHGDLKQTNDQISVHVFNTHRGQNPEIKDEINRISDVIYGKMANIFGEQNIMLVREAIRPAF